MLYNILYVYIDIVYIMYYILAGRMHAVNREFGYIDFDPGFPTPGARITCGAILAPRGRPRGQPRKKGNHFPAKCAKIIVKNTV